MGLPSDGAGSEGATGGEEAEQSEGGQTGGSGGGLFGTRRCLLQAPDDEDVGDRQQELGPPVEPVNVGKGGLVDGLRDDSGGDRRRHEQQNELKAKVCDGGDLVGPEGQEIKEGEVGQEGLLEKDSGKILSLVRERREQTVAIDTRSGRGHRVHVRNTGARRGSSNVSRRGSNIDRRVHIERDYVQSGSSCTAPRDRRGRSKSSCKRR
mmetsp:Transcript_1811/g.4327  ORF Transcript_1811/g.4327 Transcript_1811/m.4327 type:complete len:208 (-) Transcript_1811:153-776(-)